jgi:hypothetical protein
MLYNYTIPETAVTSKKNKRQKETFHTCKQRLNSPFCIISAIELAPTVDYDGPLADQPFTAFAVSAGNTRQNLVRKNKAS